MRAVILVLSIVLNGCATTPTKPATVSGQINSFSDVEIDRKTTIYFDTDGQDLGQKQIVFSCRQAAADSGLTVSSEPMKDALRMTVTSEVTGSKTGPTVTTVMPGYYAPMAFSQTVSFTSRQIKVSVFDGKREILQSNISSSGSSSTVAPVAYEMCKGFFNEYPTNRQGKRFEVDFKDQ